MLTAILKGLPYIQIVLAVLLVTLVLIQKTDSDAGGSFGGSSDSSWHTRRGGEQVIFVLTIIISIVFVASVILDLWA
ncbi:MAG: hypothetical protein RJB39_497 [Candidatus Parcubacteria bacterium]|jgi:protein translocase SecG subunit